LKTPLVTIGKDCQKAVVETPKAIGEDETDTAIANQ
jgi:hypothetical protein